MHTTHNEVDLRLRVTRRSEGAEGVVVLDLRDPDGADLPAWAPGAHIDLKLPNGLTRQYSLCGRPEERTRWRVAVLHEPDGRGGSAFVHDAVQEGAEIDVRGPRNHFALVPAQRYIFIAGGIGITPILPMVVAADAAGVRWELHYGGRSRRSMAFLATLDWLTGHRCTLHPQDEVGLIDLDAILSAPPPGTAIYCCGPEPLLNAVEQRSVDWPTGTLHLERFVAKHLDEPKFAGAFEVELAASGQTLTVPADKSILEVVEAAGSAVLSSCREGTCGTCETAVLRGEVDHRDSLLTPEEQAANDTMFICVSRAAGPRLVLDL